MNLIVIFVIGSVVFATTVYGAVMGAGIALTRRFYRQNDAYAERPGFEDAGAGQPEEVQPDGQPDHNEPEEAQLGDR